MKTTTILSAILATLMLASCNSSNEYRIHGRVTPNDLEGVQIFLVPVGHEEAWNVDSIHIRNHSFEFRGKKHWMCELRLESRHRYKGQNLLVATEPGDIYVTIGPDSSGGGTPQNDSLQVWKELTIQSGRLDNQLRGEGRLDEAIAARAAYRERTRAMAHALGDGSIAGEFLLNLYPEPKDGEKQ